MNETFLTIQEAAQKLGVSTKTLRRWEQQGLIAPERTAGNQRRYLLQDILDFRKKPKTLSVVDKDSGRTSSDLIGARMTENGILLANNFSPSVPKPTNFQQLPIKKKSLRRLLADIRQRMVSSHSVRTINGVRTIKSRTIKRFLPGIGLIFAGILFVGLGVLGQAMFFSMRAHPRIYTKSLGLKPTSSGQVLGAQSANELFFNVNIQSKFNNTAQFLKDISVDGAAVFNKGLSTNNQDINAGTGAITAGTVTASNLVYSVKAGTGLSATTGQNPILSNTGVLSLGGSTGDLSLVAGSGITVSGLTITNSDPGSSQKIFKTINVDSSSIAAGSNSDTLTFKSGSGVSLSTSGSTITFSQSSLGGWTQSGSNVLLTDPTNSVGIGTTDPSLFKLQVAGSIGPNSDGVYDLGSPTHKFRMVYADSFSNAPSFPWQEVSGSVAPLNITDDLNMGSIATSSALVHFTGTNGHVSFFNGGNVGVGNVNPAGLFSVGSTSQFQVNSSGNVTATTINGNTITSGTGTLSLAAGKTVSFSDAFTTSGAFPITLNAGAATSVTLPSTGTLLTDTATAVQNITSTQNSGTLFGLSDSTSISNTLIGQSITLSGTGAHDQTGLQFNLSGASGANLNDIIGTGNSWNVTTTGDATFRSVTTTGGSSLVYNGTFKATNGSAASPSYQFINSAGTGMYLPSNNILGLATNGTEKMRIDSSGNVGIGTSSPQGLVDIEGAPTGNALVTLNYTGGSSQNLFVASNSGATKFVLDSTGAITTGSFKGTAVSEAYGGTNQTSYVTGDILYSSAVNTLTRLPIGASGKVLSVSSLGIPSWASLSGSGGVCSDCVITDPTATYNNIIAASASGTVPITLRGNAAQNVDIFDVQNSTGATNYFSINNTGIISAGTWNGTAISSAYGGTGMTSYSPGDILYASDSGVLTKLARGSQNQVISISSVTQLPVWGNITGGGGICTDCVINDPTVSSVNTIAAGASGVVPLTLRGYTSGNGDLLDIQNPAGSANYLKINSSGDLVLNNNTYFANGSTYSISSNGTATLPTINGGFTNSVFFNGNTISTGSGTLTLGAGKTLTANKTLTLDGTDGVTLNINSTTSLNTNAIQFNSSSESLTLTSAKSVSFADAFTTSGAYPITFTAASSTSVTLPPTGTLLTNTSAIGQGIASSQGSGTAFALSNSANLSADLIGQSITLNNTGAHNLTGLEFNLTDSSALTRIDLQGTNSSWEVDSSGNAYFKGTLAIGTTTAGSQVQFNIGSASTIGQILRSFSGQTADFEQFQDASGNILAKVDANGAFTSTASASFNSILAAGSSIQRGLVIQNTALGNPKASLSINGTAQNVFEIRYGTSGNDASRIAIDSSGNIGFNTASPLALLDVRGTNGINSVSATAPVASISGSTTNASLIVSNDGTGDIFTASSSGAYKFVIQSSGNVGIGTNLPTQPLQVIGNIYGTDINATNGINTNGAQRIDATGNLVAIGTINSTYLKTTTNSVNFDGASTILQLNGTEILSAAGDLSNINSINLSGAGTIRLGATGANNILNTAAAGGAPTGDLYWGNRSVCDSSGNCAGVGGSVSVSGGSANFVPRFTSVSNITAGSIFDNGTNLGIGTTSPLAGLDLRASNNSFPVASISGSTIQASLVVDNSSTGNIFVASASGATRFVIANNGNVGIGTASPAEALDLAGRLVLESTTIPSTTTNKLYNASGALSWAGDTICLHDANNCAGVNYWARSLGSLSPLNITDDLLIGGTATTSAKFAFINNAAGSPTASISGNLGLVVPTGATPSDNLNILNGGSFAIQTSVGGDAGLASRLSIANNGTLTLPNYNGQNAVLYGTQTTGVLASATTTSGSQCLMSGASAPSWGACPGSGSGASKWTLSTGVLFPNSINQLVGIGTITPGDITSSLYLTHNLASGATGKALAVFNQTENQDIFTASSSGVTKFIIGNDGTLTMSKYTTGIAHLSSLGVLSSSAVSLTADVSGILPIANGGTNNSSAYTAGSIIFSDGTSLTQNNSNLFWDNTNNRLGIGTTGPVSKAQIVGDTVALTLTRTSSPLGGLLAFTDQVNTIKARMGIDTADNNFFIDNGTTTALTILNSNGNVGIGTTSPQALLHVDGGTLGGNAAAIINQTGASANDIFSASSSGVTKFIIANNGTITASAYNTASGLLYANGSGVISQTAQGGANTVLHGNGTSAPTFSAISLTSDVTGILPTANGGTNQSTYTTGDILYSSATNTLAKLGIGGSGSILTVSAGGVPSWSPSSAINFWQRANGSLSPLNITDDLLIGGTATTSAKFAFINNAGGSPTASISGNLGLVVPTGATPTENLNILNGGSFAIQTSVGGDAGLASRLSIANNGTLTLPNYNGQNAVLYGTQTTGVLASTTTTSASQCLMSGASAPAWGACPGSGSGASKWTLSGNALYPNAANQLVGIGTITAGDVTSSLYLTHNLASGATGKALAVFNQTENQDIFTASSSGVTKFIIGNDGTLTMSKYGAGIAHLSSSGVLSSSAINLGGGSSEITGILPTANGGTGQDFSGIAQGSLPYFSGTGMTTLGTGTAGYVLSTNGSGQNPTWVNGASLGYWTQTLGALSPTNNTVDLLIGGQATTSAKFAFINNLVGSPTASISGNLGLVVPTGATPTENLNILNGGTFNIQTSVGGDAGLASRLSIGNDGTVTMAKYGTGIAHLSSSGVLSSSAINLAGSDVTGTLGVGNGGTGTGTTFTQGSMVFAGASGAYSQDNANLFYDSTNHRLGIGTTSPTSSFSVGSTSQFQVNSTGDIAKINNVAYSFPTSQAASANRVLTNDALGNLSWQTVSGVGGVSGTGAAGQLTYWNSSSGLTGSNNLFLDTNTYYLGLGTNTPLARLDVRSSDLSKPVASISGTTNQASLIVNNDGSGNLFTASSSAAAMFTIANNGTLTDTIYNSAGGLLYANGSGVISQSLTGTTGQCLTSSGGSAPTWGACGGAAIFAENNGAIYPLNSTEDLLIGGTATTSAKFAFINNAGGSPTASISGNLSLAVPTGSTPTDNLNIFNGGSFAIQTSVGGDAGLASRLSIGNDGTLTMSKYTTGIAHLSSSGVLSSSAINLAGGTSEITGILPTANGGTGQDFSGIAQGSLPYFSGTGMTTLGTGTAGYVLSTNGSGQNPTWVNGASLGYWTQTALGTLSPTNNTVDLLIGGQATTSAKFAFINNLVGSPTASISGNLGLVVPTGATPSDNLNILNGGSFAIQTSVGGDAGLASRLSVGNDGTVTMAKYGTGIAHFDGTGKITSSAISLGGSDVTGTLGVGNGGTGTGTTFTQGSMVFAGVAGAYSQDNANLFYDSTNHRLGIGTSTPLEALDVRATSGTLSVASVSGSTSFASLVVDNSGSGDLFTASTSGLTKFTINNAGHVGLGRGLPLTALSNNLFSAAYDSSDYLTMNVDSAGKVYFNAVGSTPGDFYFGQDGTATTMTLYSGAAGKTASLSTDTSGNVTLNTTSGIVNVGGASGNINIDPGANNLYINGNGLTYMTFNTNAFTYDYLTNATGNFVSFNSSSLTTGNELYITGGSGTGMTTGSLVNVAAATYKHTAAETGNAANITFADNSATGANTWTTNTVGLNIAPTINVTGASATHNIYGAYIQPLTVTAAAGTANGYGLRVGNQGGTNMTNSYGLYVDAQTGATNNYAAIFAGGNVGIGTTSPTASLHISGAGPGNTGSLKLQNTNGKTWELGEILSNNTFNIYDTAVGSRLAIDTNGNVGIGTTAPTALLHVNGGNSGGNAAAIINQTGVSTNDILTASASGTTKFTIANNGNITATGTLTGLTGLTSSGTINFSGLTASSGVYTDASKNLTSTIPTSGSIGYLQRNAQALSPTNITDDLLVGAISTASAYVDLLGTAATTGTQATINANSVTTGYGLTVNANALTTGYAEYLSSTSTALSTGGLESLYWNPGSATTSTGDLLSLNVGANATIGNLLNIKNNGSSVFSVSQTQITNALPTSFTAPGDVSMAYDLNFTNPTVSYIKSQAPLNLQAGETFNSSDLTLRTFNSGQGVFDFAGGATLNQAQTWTLASSVTGLTFKDSSANTILNLDSTNDRVGIGTTSPAALLQISGGTLGGNAALIVNQTGASTNDIFTASASGTTKFTIGNNGNLNSVAGAKWLPLTDSTSALNIANAAGTSFATFDTTNQRVGIGTTSPVALLQISGGTLGGNAAEIINQTGASTNDIFTASASGTTKFTIGNNGTLTASAYNTASGLLYANGSGVISQTAQGAANTVLHGNGASAPTFSAVSLTSDVTGILPTANGGTNQSTYTTGDMLYSSAANTLAKLGIGSSGSILTVSAGVPSWSPSSTINFWQRASGSLSPLNITDDLLIGGTATTSAKFAFINNASGTPTASISGNLSLAVPTGSTPTDTLNILNGGTFAIQTSVGGDAGLASRFTVLNNGNVGIGTATPGNPLSLSTSLTATSSAFFVNNDTSANNSVLALKVGAATPGTGNRFINFLGGNGDILGKITGNGNTTSVVYNSNGGDFAEYYKKADSQDSLDSGTLVCLAKAGVAACDQNNNKILGVVSNRAGFVGAGGHDNDPSYVLVGIIGQLDVKVASSSAPINSGDPLTSSSTKGTVEKVTTAGQIVGHAMGTVDSNGEVMVAVNVSWFDPTTYIGIDGNLVATVIPASFVIPAQAGIQENGSPIRSGMTGDGSGMTGDGSGMTGVTPDLSSTVSAQLSTLSSQVANLSSKVDFLENVASTSALLMASSSAGLNTNYADLAKLLDGHDLSLNNATVSGSLDVLGRTTVSDLGVTGTISSGLLVIDGLNSDIHTISGPLMLQSDGINGIDIGSGALTIDGSGNVITRGTITAAEVDTKAVKTDKLNIATDVTASNSAVLAASAGVVVIKAGYTSIDVRTSSLSDKSLIFVTPNEPVTIGAKQTNSTTFNIKLGSPATQDIKVNWWIVN